jgi:hypothetical protein
VAKTVNGGATAAVRMQKGTQAEVAYKITSTRTVDAASVALTVSGSFSISNPNGAPAAPPPDNTITLTGVSAVLRAATGSAADRPVVLSGCGSGTSVAPGGSVACTFAATQFAGQPGDTAKLVVTVTYSDNSAAPAVVGDATAESAPVSGVGLGRAAGAWAAAGGDGVSQGDPPGDPRPSALAAHPRNLP